MKIQYREAKSIITKSNIPDVDFVINPYIGCQHGCIYCYAEFMIRFTNHKGDKWGQFLDIKRFDLKKIKPQKYDDKRILLSSVTDPYIPLELKYKNTRGILENLVGTKAEITILTKSKFVVRDIDLFKKFANIEVGISISTLDENLSNIIERGASKPLERLMALKEIHKNRIRTYTFISPFFPELTNFQEIIRVSKPYTDYYMFENLNFRPHNIPRIMKLIKDYYPALLSLYQDFRLNHSRWDIIEQAIRDFCLKEKIKDFSIEFHHGGFSKS
ncbi:MAG: radical SAM protein [Promethearchaeota archaeon]